MTARGIHNSGLTGGPINGAKPPLEVLEAATIPEPEPEPEPDPTPPRTIKPIRPTIRPKGK